LFIVLAAVITMIGVRLACARAAESTSSPPAPGLVAMGDQRFQCALAVGSLLDSVAVRFQPMTQDEPDARIVVGDQYGSARGFGGRFGQVSILRLHRSAYLKQPS
jgi:hypothetical protein